MQIIDIKALSEMFLGDTSKVKLVVDALIQRIPEWQEEAQICANTKDHEETRQLCHRIRGAASSIKAEKLAQAATDWGDIIKANDFDKTQASFAALNSCLTEILTLPPEDLTP